MPDISIAVPCYNEQEGLQSFVDCIIPILEKTGLKFEIVFVNDGSTDDTWKILTQLRANHDCLKIIDLSRNFGKEAALTAALDHCQGSAIIPIDADLQDPPDMIPEMIRLWHQGYEVVIAKRRTRKSDLMGKRVSADWFYRLFNLLADTSIPHNAGDFRLIDRKVLRALQQLRETNRFMKGLFSWVGFRTATIEFDRQPRIAGNTKWSSWRLWNFALNGIFSFSNLPLRVWTYIGAAVSSGAFLYAAFLITRTLITGVDVPGYASIMVVMLFLGGIQLVGIGILGEYIGKIFTEVKNRPLPGT
ncbi:MAG: glycosyltransferase family 2 protein [Verrucomicrobia bacterium]|nr:glycosyltransferase family 2 protein [Verrucomicrobiota bacterium]